MNWATLNLVLAPIVGGLIGWVTNFLAIRMLFRPRRAVRILPFVPAIQGLVPRRQTELAHSIGEIVEQELVTGEDLATRLRESGVAEEAVDAIVAHVNARVEVALPPFVPGSLRVWLHDHLSGWVHSEAESFVHRILSEAEGRLASEANLGSIVEEKIMSFDLDRLEEVILRVSGNELKAIEVLGGVLGFLVGLIQAGLLVAFGRA